MDSQKQEVSTTPDVYNIHEIFIPTEYAYIDYQRSWKKCHCGRVAQMRDNYCGGCGQKLGFPQFND